MHMNIKMYAWKVDVQYFCSLVVIYSIICI